MLCRELDGIEHAQYLVEVAAGAHWVTEHQLDLLVRPDYEHSSHSSIGGRGAAFRCIACIRGEHVVQLGDFELRVANHRIVHFVSLGFFDVDCPLAVTAHRIDAQSDNLAITLLKLGLQTGHIAKFRGAHRGEILGMGEQNGPAIADPFVKIDTALRGLGSEIGSFVIYAQHRLSPGAFQRAVLEFILVLLKSRTV